MKRTKIVATMGPSSEPPEILRQMMKAGMNVARINFSHGTHETNGKIIDTVRNISHEVGLPVGIMADLQGPRIRVAVDNNTEIKRGGRVIISDVSSGKDLTVGDVLAAENAQSIINMDVPKIIRDINLYNVILIEDGLMRVKVVKKAKTYLVAEVLEGGVVKNHKGVNIPDAPLKIGAVTKKDLADLEFVLSKDVDFVALSFVSNKKEIEDTRKRMKKILGEDKIIPLIVAKIERKEAIHNIDEIISSTDIIMVARGDLGIELEESRVVIFQKEIIAKCLRAGKPVIVATQMLNSMIENPLPTRAEVSDVSNAVLDHTDAVMLSGETANGKFPVKVIETMTEIIKSTEGSPFDSLVHGFLGDSKTTLSAAVAHSAHELAKDSGSKAIVVASLSGFTARMIARHRPEQEVFVMTNSKKTYNQLSILWGTSGFVLPDCDTLDELITESVKTLLKCKILKKKDKIVIVTGRPHIKREHMSLVKVEEIK